MKKWLDNLFSVDEFKISILGLCLVASLTVALILVFTIGEINDGLVTIVLGLISGIAGVNITSAITNRYKSPVDIPTVTTSDMQSPETTSDTSYTPPVNDNVDYNIKGRL